MNKRAYLGILLLSAAVVISCGEKTPQAQGNAPAATGEAAKQTVGNVAEKAEYETSSAIKFRKEPNTSAALVKCKVLGANCNTSACSGDSAVIGKGEIVRTVEHTAVPEKISGAEGYWYKVDKTSFECEAWVFGGFLKLIYSEADAGKPVTLHDPKIKGDRGVAAEKCNAMKMKLAGKSELIRGLKSGLIKGEGSSGEFWYLRPSGDVAMVNLPGTNDLIAGGMIEAEFRCVK